MRKLGSFWTGLPRGMRISLRTGYETCDTANNANDASHVNSNFHRHCLRSICIGRHAEIRLNWLYENSERCPFDTGRIDKLYCTVTRQQHTTAENISN